jgi:hypothetical protein
MKFLDTNITVDGFVASLKQFKDGLPKLIDEWPDIDPELKNEYIDQMQWMLDKAAEFIVISSNNKE